ncbi:DUF305 domain-containing protein [Helicobacter sp. MIT 21-1697]|uniref:DUF305 domain-containing protein n=1 Tax=Helicobacter sp. MIT 21-1697 TaxID=2993733 RepID=UPI00224B3A30|nr:DUF305 domain-containing protein [Helicobacter sp. MIT 21-1697]MCX2717646.1 DUF305 domain-containing protein [Helicobacter sp. MIT 21-1697]
MKNITLSNLLPNLVASISLISAAAIAEETIHSTHTHEYKTNSTISEIIINSMHKPMMDTAFVESDNIDLNYLSNMIPHHQGAIDASQMLLKYSHNQKVRAQAQAIIKEQNAEIQEFQALLPQLQEQKKLYSPKEITLFNNQAKTDMDTMMKAMSEIKLSNQIDRDFLEGMIPHHQGAIDASKQILIYTQNEDIKNIAKRIIQSQGKEIETFQAILKTIR